MQNSVAKLCIALKALQQQGSSRVSLYMAGCTKPEKRKSRDDGIVRRIHIKLKCSRCSKLGIPWKLVGSNTRREKRMKRK